MSSCIIPGVGKPGLELAENEIEIGMGIHGEPGVERTTVKTAKYPNGNEIKPFAEAFLNDNVVKIFEMEPTCVDEHEMKVNFHYCPLVAAWLKLGFSEADIATFCDIAMDGDRGIVKEFPEFEFELGKTIAKGDSICEVTVRKKE